MNAINKQPLIINFEDLTLEDLARVGGKNASLGEMIGTLSSRGIRVPNGFATSAEMYRDFVATNGLDKIIHQELGGLKNGLKKLAQAGARIRVAFKHSEFTTQQQAVITDAYDDLCKKAGRERLPVAVRSSATAEDLPEASFAGQQESYLNVRGIEDVLERCRDCYASLYTDRAIAYRRRPDRSGQPFGRNHLCRHHQAKAGIG